MPSDFSPICVRRNSSQDEKEDDVASHDPLKKFKRKWVPSQGSFPWSYKVKKQQEGSSTCHVRKKFLTFMLYFIPLTIYRLVLIFLISFFLRNLFRVSSQKCLKNQKDPQLTGEFLHVLLYNWYRQPLSKYSLRYDKLLVDKDVYVFNELSGTVEQVGGGIQEEMDLTASSSPTTPYRSSFNQLTHEKFTVRNSPSTIDIDFLKIFIYLQQ